MFASAWAAVAATGALDVWAGWLGTAARTLPAGVWGGLTVAILVTSALVFGRRRPAPSDGDARDPAPDPFNSFVTGFAGGNPTARMDLDRR